MLYEAVRDIARSRPGKPAIRTTDGRTAGYAELLDLADRTAAGLLARGVGPGRTVATALRNSIGYVALILAAARIGAKYVPLMTNFDAADIRTALRISEPVLVVADPARDLPDSAPPRVTPEELASAAPLGPADATGVHSGPFRLLWTSGSTGFPKQMAWRQDRFVAERRRWLADTGITDSDVFFCRHTLDVAHATDLHVFAALLSGATLVLADPQAPPAELLRLIAASGATAMSALPSHYEEYVRAADQAGAPDLSRLRRPLCGGAYLAPAVIHDAARVLGIHIRQIYGSTEFGLALGNMADEPQTDLSMVPVRGVQTRLEPLTAGHPDLGELVLRSDCTSEGYLNDAEAHARTFRGEEFWTGDVARRAPDGSYRILGRVTEALATPDGPLIAPVLDDEITAAAPVCESVTVPVRPGAYRDEVCVVVTLPPGTAHDDAVKSVRAVTGAHGLTAQVHIAEAIPRTPVGKPDKPLIRRRWIEEGSHG